MNKMVLVWVGLMLWGCDRTHAALDPCRGFDAGDVVISEYMSDPSGPDKGGEWFEIYNATSRPLSLQRLTLVVARYDGTSERAHVMTGGEMAPGSYFVVGNAREGARPSYVNYSYDDDLGDLPNSEGMLAIRCADTVIDTVRYHATSTAGHSRSLDGARAPDSVADDAEGHWCDASEPTESGIFGSPGERNEPCAAPLTCLDGATKLERSVRPPQPGDLVIAEVMADPAGADATGEWIEIWVRNEVDLNGVTLVTGAGRAARYPIRSESCIGPGAGHAVVLARNVESAQNGGLPSVVGHFSSALPSEGKALRLLRDDTLLDEVTYGPSRQGYALQLSVDKLDAQANDDPSAWCQASPPWGSQGDHGTPGAVNGRCP